MSSTKKAVPHAARGRLIALEGTCGPDLTAAAKRLMRAVRDAGGAGGVSGWDSSGIFTELVAAEEGVAAPSARTLTLLYAADLAFRLRWQIQPALEEGQSVVAAPYIHSAIALGIAAGLPKRWLTELFHFAPKPHVSYRIGERAARGKVSTSDGYAEFFYNALEASGDTIDVTGLRKRSIEYLRGLDRRHRCSILTARAIAGWGRARTS
jgi:hypothetical protein